jgi:trimeric autotransporter adhesin
MKNSKYILHSVAVLAVAALATACSSEDELTDKTSGNNEILTITAYQSNTRAGFDSEGAGYWQAGDKIGVIFEVTVTGLATNGTFPAEAFTISTGAGTAQATFAGTQSNKDYVAKYAMYPYNSGHKHETTSGFYAGNNAFTYALPSSYTYTTVDQDYSQKNGNSFCMPMFGKISNNEVTFNNIGGVICMKIDEMPAESGTVTVKEASNQLCGNFTIDTSIPSISTSASTSDNTVTFNYSCATAGQPGVFYLPVATGTYTLTVTVAGGETTKDVTTKALTMERGHLKKVNISQ